MDIYSYALFLLAFDVLMDKMQPFQFVVRPRNTTVSIGDNISLECTADENSLYFTWEYKPLKDLSNKDGTVLGFCYRGKPCVVKIWNDQLRITNTSRLHLQNVSSAHGGQYICETAPSNGYDIIKTSAWIFVKTPPILISIDFNKSQNTFEENEDIEIKCSASGGDPTPDVSIYIVSQNVLSPLRIEPGNRLLSQSNEVTVQSLWRPAYAQNRGFVMCTATNEAGQLTRNSSLLNIKFEPKIHSFKSTNISAISNQTIDLNCLVSANPPATVWWSINNGLRLIASSQLVTKVQPEMAGNLTCSAENSLGSKSLSLNLVVLTDPVITLQPLHRIHEKTDSSVSCQVNATPDPDFVKWYKLSSNSNSYSTLVSNDFQLNFIKIDRSSTGKYVCVTRNTQRSSDGKTKEVTVEKFMELIVTYQPGEPWIKSDNDIKVQKGEQLRITCSANSLSPGEPFPTLSWVDVETRNTVSSSYEFFIEKVSSVNNGNYQCVAKNEFGSTLSSKILIISVNEKPIIISHKTPNVFLSYRSLRESVTFPCSFQGQPLHSVNWHYQGARLSSVKDYQISTYRSVSPERAILIASNLTVKLYHPRFSQQSTTKTLPSGTYSCETTNEYGTASFDYFLVIKYPPLIKINHHERKVFGSLGQEFVSIKCQIESIEEPQVTWFRTTDRMELSKLQDRKYTVVTIYVAKYNLESDIFSPGIKITELRIFDLVLTDFTEYSCVASNDQGSTKELVHLVFTSIPDVPYDVKISSVEWDSVTISWRSGFNGGLEQSFEINMYSDVFGLLNVPFYIDKIEKSLIIKGLHPNTNYSIQLQAVNVIGRSDGSSNVTFVTKKILKFESIYARILSDPPRIGMMVPDTDLCANLDYTRDSGRQWFNIEHCLKFNTSQVNVTVFLDISRMTSIHDLQTGAVHLRLTFCLLSRPGICSNHMVLDNPKNNNFMTQTLILVIAVICFILIIIHVVLFIACCIRFKSNCKNGCYCCRRAKYDRSYMSNSRLQLIKRVSNNHDIINDGRISCDETLEDTVVTTGSPTNYCSSLIGCSTPHNKTNKHRKPKDVYSSFTCQHQGLPPVYCEGSSFLQSVFSWPQNVNSQSYEASSSNSHSSAGSSSRTTNPKSCLRYRMNQETLSNSVIINQKSLLELNEKIQLPDVTSEAIHFAKSLDTVEAVV